MKVYLSQIEYKYEVEKTFRLFLPFERYDFVDTPATSGDRAKLICKGDIYAVTVYYKDNTVSRTQTFLHDGEFSFTRCLFLALCELTKTKPVWGMLTGVRPERLYRQNLQTAGEGETDRLLLEDYMVSRYRLNLLKTVYNNEEKIIGLSTPQRVSLYISIPFCPSRCRYCSFVSESVENMGHLMEPYVTYLIKEIEYTAARVKKLGLSVKTVYMGGGTPTSLAPKMLQDILGAVHKNFDLSQNLEVTVEAGRPDSITKEKLQAILPYATRLCINPQTLNDKVLQNIGRRHTAKQFFEALDLAKSLGFENINADIIAGLPGDSFDSFKNTVDTLSTLELSSVTVHTLSVKRAAYYGKNAGPLPFDDTQKMVDYARAKLTGCGMQPYYLYRQSKTAQNLENVGYAVPGNFCLYNVYIMDETHTIIGLGAGAVTKLKAPYGEKIERLPNFKFPYEYIDRFDTILSRKDKIGGFYNADH